VVVFIEYSRNEGTMRPIVAIISESSDLFGFMSGEFRIIGDIQAAVAPRKRRKAPGAGRYHAAARLSLAPSHFLALLA
jgi:hypothetical protein